MLKRIKTQVGHTPACQCVCLTFLYIYACICVYTLKYDCTCEHMYTAAAYKKAHTDTNLVRYAKCGIPSSCTQNDSYFMELGMAINRIQPWQWLTMHTSLHQNKTQCRRRDCTLYWCAYSFSPYLLKTNYRPGWLMTYVDMAYVLWLR